MRKLVLAFLLGAGCGGETSAPPARTAQTAQTAQPAQAEHDGATAKRLVQDGARLVDVRSPDEFAAGHIDGAQNVPVDTIDAADLGSKDAGIVVYCASGRRAARAASSLRSRGYTHVYELGAMSNWPK